MFLCNKKVTNIVAYPVKLLEVVVIFASALPHRISRRSSSRLKR